MIDSRRAFLRTLAASAALPFLRAVPAIGAIRTRPPAAALRIRTITAGVGITSASQLGRIEKAITALERSKKMFESEGYEVQTLRIATPPIVAGVTPRARDAGLAELKVLDDLAAGREIRVSIGPLLSGDVEDLHLGEWAAELIRSTKLLNASVMVASAQGAFPKAATAAARVMRALAHGTTEGLGNFRFAAIANVPPGTPFFPAAYHRGPDSLALGLESASLVEKVFAEQGSPLDATTRLRNRLEESISPIARRATEIARREGLTYLGVDPSPAPGPDRSIGAGIEALTGRPFGTASTLDACAAVTAAVKSLRLRTCGYAGLMLPVLEDQVLARRATEGRYGVQELLLYSSVCGTGLDVVPIPGDTPEDIVSRIILDVATLSTRLRKPLSARLFLIPGKAAGDMAHFDDPYLTDSTVMKPE